jgi:alpha-mannosidase
VPAHKWADLSEADYGVSLLNDCKYGYDIRGDVLRLTLIKSAIDPDPNADAGEHRFTYSLLPHRGDWRTATPAQAYALNYPLVVWAKDGRPQGERVSRTSFITVEAPNVILETIKQAEDGEGVIVRLYESGRTRQRVTLTSAVPLVSAERCDLLEEKTGDVDCDGQAVKLALKPYEIVTLRLRMQK